MPTFKYKPTTPARRQMTVPTFEELTKFTPEKSLIVIKKKHSGRNSYGRITVRHRGGGNKQKYRIIDFKRADATPATVIGIEYDPNRSAYIALLENEAGVKSYVIAPVGLNVGDKVYAGADASFNLYEDENVNYNYEKGFYANIPITWHDAARTLAIGERKGSFEGMLGSRKFRVVVVDPEHPWAYDPDAPGVAVSYDGRPIGVKF